jgi:CHASE2 domain-containing sensor protein
MLLVFITIYLYQPKNIRNWLIPFIGFLAVALISYVVLTLLNKQDFILNHYVFSINITSDFILEWKNSLKLLLYILASLILFILTFLKLSKSGQGRINTMRLIAIFFFMGLIINLLESFNEVTPILITFFPTSVFLTIYIENMKRSKLKEAVLILTVIIPFIVLFIRFG